MEGRPSKAEAQRFLDLVTGIIAVMKVKFGLTHYKIEVEYTDHDEDEASDELSHASVAVNPKYLSARISLYRNLYRIYKEQGEGKLKQILCHELAHIYVGELVEVAERRYANSEELTTAVERLAETVGRMMYTLLSKD